MNLSLHPDALARLVRGQLDAFFPDGHQPGFSLDVVARALGRFEVCALEVADRRFYDGQAACFNHLHGDQYAMFLYLLANQIYREDGDRSTCDKLFGLCKALYCIDAFYEVELPRIFLFCHASGSVLGRAQYGDYLLVHQQCTVGAARAAAGAGRGVFPRLGRHLSLYAGAAVLGGCVVGDNCKVAAHSLLMNKRLSANTMYRGTPQAFETATNLYPDNVWRAGGTIVAP
jgi:serine O-acetyltransferase